MVTYTVDVDAHDVMRMILTKAEKNAEKRGDGIPGKIVFAGRTGDPAYVITTSRGNYYHAERVRRTGPKSTVYTVTRLQNGVHALVLMTAISAKNKATIERRRRLAAKREHAVVAQK